MLYIMGQQKMLRVNFRHKGGKNPNKGFHIGEETIWEGKRRPTHWNSRRGA